jgi:hypothetical protein
MVLLVAGALTAQERFMYPAPDRPQVEVKQDIEFAPGLKLDLYRAPGSERVPVFLFANTLGGGRVQRDWPIYQGWARLAATRGFGAVVMDASNHPEQDFDSLLAYLAQHGAELGIDGNTVAVYAASANVTRGFALVENPKRSSVKAAVMYYGASDAGTLRPDLPVLFVRAGLDRPAMNRELDALAAAMLKANAPVRVLNHASGHHGFEVIDDSDTTREVIDETLRFVASALKPEYQRSLRETVLEAQAAGAVMTGDYATAAANYGALVPARPNDIRLLLSYGEALIGAQRYKEARTQLDRVKTLGGAGPRDLGVPAARAAALDHDTAAAIAWLESIPARFRPKSLVDDPAFASMRNLPEFKKLFER